MTTLSQILENKIVAIIRGANPDDVLKIINALFEGGIMVLEITLNSPKALAVIEEAATKVGNKMLVGAGTVMDAESARAALLAGAKFIISPSLNIETIKMTKRYGAVSIPGAFTPTEIVNAFANGADIIKVFPASPGIQYFKELMGPLSHIPLMPTGGINLENINEFQKAGAVAFGIGSALVDTKHKVTEEYLQQLTDKARKFVQAVSNS
ncbi:MAG: bifunctional 4-hydroxy-2-oxoglutarate aldolase/2-dehydro-3-deoxy-phosphogluconate aldolase [Chitinophagaceae bacterium]|nr:bifunctional 4-hydroxy-2-oxoglutarate aldolase/2-dehydro-3-deoxy-phosphogluconate aldolase [Chitinophagaceae bacterium]